MHRSNGRAIMGGVFILFGALLIADNFSSIPIHIFSWYVIFIIIGTAILSSSHRSASGLFLLFFGILGLFSKIFDFSIRFVISEYWPVALILFGLYIITKPRYTGSKHFTNNEEYKYDFIDETSAFSDNKKVLLSKNFKGGKVTTFFGSTTLDLRNAELAESKNILDVLTIFGGITIKARNDFNIIVNVTSIFGGFEDKRNKNIAEVPQSDRSLNIKGLTLFGGGVIYN